jgi:hypothetical protein
MSASWLAAGAIHALLLAGAVHAAPAAVPEGHPAMYQLSSSAALAKQLPAGTCLHRLLLLLLLCEPYLAYCTPRSVIVHHKHLISWQASNHCIIVCLTAELMAPQVLQANRHAACSTSSQHKNGRCDHEQLLTAGDFILLLAMQLPTMYICGMLRHLKPSFLA